MKILLFLNLQTCIFAQFENLQNAEMIKELFPVFKMSFKNLDHEKMHREMEEDVGEIVFVERMFDYCVGENTDFMTIEEDKKCGKRFAEDFGKSFPQYAEILAEEDPGKVGKIFEDVF